MMTLLAARCSLLHLLISIKALQNRVLPHAFVNRGDAKLFLGVQFHACLSKTNS